MTAEDIQQLGLNNEVFEFLSQAFEDLSFEVLPLAGDASMRRYFRVIYADQSYVLMVWEPFGSISEYPFLNVLKHFEKHKVQVPEVLRIDPAKGLILLEDLGDLTLERIFWENQDQNLVIPFYRQAIDELIKIHFNASDDHDPKCRAFQIQFNTEKFLWEMNYARENLLEKIVKVRLDDQQNRILDKSFLSICERLDKEPKRISHRDYHSRNVMVKLGKMRVIDFQDARLGPVQYDLVSLIHDSYVRLNETSERMILDDYLTKAKRHGLSPSRDQFMEIYNLQMVQRCFKACGSFSSFYNNRSDTRYLKYIRPTVKKVLKSLDHFPEYREFQRLLLDHPIFDFKPENLCES